jgi:hypothetical protein
MRLTLDTLKRQTMGRLRPRTSRKQRSMTLVVRNFFQRVFGEVEEGEPFGQMLFQPFQLRGVDAPRGNASRFNRVEVCFFSGSGLRCLAHNQLKTSALLHRRIYVS